MSAVTSHCSNCGSFLEADCDFCTSCGARRLKHQDSQTSQPAHSWMGDAPRQNESRASRPQNLPPPPMQVAYAYPINQPQIQSQDGTANTARTLGIVTISLAAVGLIPCLGWLNYFAFILSIVTLIISIVAISNAKSSAARSAAVIGLVFALVAAFVGFIRLILGGGCL